MEEIVEKFKEILEINDRELSLSDEFRKYDEWDSLTYLSVIAMLDEEYGIQIEENEFKQLKTIGDLLNAVKSKQKM